MKRTIDILVSAFALLVLSPLLVVLALLVAITSPGGAFFRQERIGRGGEPFRLVKFRSMQPVRDAERGRFDAGSDARVTGIGRVLRRTKLDELPQLWNVLVGEMSIVGPRPEVARWTAVFPERWAVVHTVRPGITDRASILYRHEEEELAAAADPEVHYRDVILPRKLDLAEAYAREHPLREDAAIVLATARAVLFD